MKKILAFIASGVIPTFIPICALLTLPVCIVQKYIPQDVQNSFSYGIRFFQLVLDPKLETRSEKVARKVESVPVVESMVSSMTFAAEDECEEMPTETYTAQPVTVAVVNKHTAEAINVLVKQDLYEAQTELKQLEILRDLKIAVPAEKFEVALERALQNVEAKISRVEHIKKKDSKALRLLLKKKAQIPA